MEQRLGENNLGYFLTSQGAEKWESFSDPQWDHYISWITVYVDSLESGKEVCKSEITCADRSIVERLIQIPYLLSLDNSPIELIPNTVVWETLAPWQVTYWKTLSTGYRAKYQFVSLENDRRERQFPDLVRQKRKAQTWYRDISNWYTNYYSKSSSE